MAPLSIAVPVIGQEVVMARFGASQWAEVTMLAAWAAVALAVNPARGSAAPPVVVALAYDGSLTAIHAGRQARGGIAIGGHALDGPFSADHKSSSDDMPAPNRRDRQRTASRTTRRPIRSGRLPAAPRRQTCSAIMVENINQESESGAQAARLAHASAAMVVVTVWLMAWAVIGGRQVDPAAGEHAVTALRHLAVLMITVHAMTHVLATRVLKAAKQRGMTGANRALTAYRDPRRVTHLDLCIAWIAFYALAPLLV